MVSKLVLQCYALGAAATLVGTAFMYCFVLGTGHLLGLPSDAVHAKAAAAALGVLLGGCLLGVLLPCFQMILDRFWGDR